jgi:hypothetical protein
MQQGDFVAKPHMHVQAAFLFHEDLVTSLCTWLSCIHCKHPSMNHPAATCYFCYFCLTSLVSCFIELLLLFLSSFLFRQLYCCLNSTTMMKIVPLSCSARRTQNDKFNCARHFLCCSGAILLYAFIYSLPARIVDFEAAWCKVHFLPCRQAWSWKLSRYQALQEPLLSCHFCIAQCQISHCTLVQPCDPQLLHIQ